MRIRSFNLKTTRNVEKIKETNDKRVFLIDASRTVAVLLMIITHVIALTFSHKEGASNINFFIGTIGGTASFTLFLLVSGATSYFTTISVDSTDKKQVNRRRFKSIRRTIQLLLSYYLLAALSLFVYGLAFTTHTTEAIMEDILRILLLLRVPEFTEFLVTFVVFSFSLIFFRRLYKLIVRDYRILLFAGFISYFIGALLYQLDLGSDRANLIKALFSGHGNLHTFPFFQYFPILLIGLFLGRLLSTRTEVSFKEFLKLLLKFLLGLVSLTVGAVILNQLIPNAIFGYSISNARFPPQIGFILLSTTISFAVIILIYAVEKYLFKIKRLILFIGKNALSYFVAHTAILLLFRYYMDNVAKQTDWKYDRFIEILLIYVLVLVVSSLLIYLKEKFVSAYYIADGYLNTHYYLLNFVFPIVAILMIAGTLYYTHVDNNRVSGQGVSWNIDDLKRNYTVKANKESWYDNNFRYHQKINIEDLTSDQVYISQRWALVVIDHKLAVEGNKLRKKDGSDIRVIQLDSSGYSEVPSIIRDPNSNNTQVLFRFNQSGSEYFIYYGNDFSNKLTEPSDQAGIDNAVQVNLGEKQEHLVNLETNRRWFLKDYQDTEQLKFNINIGEEIRNVQYISYKVENTNLMGEMVASEEGAYYAEFSTSGLNTGYYTIEATVVELADSLNIYNSYKVPFFVSYPLFTTWTLDWEGWGVGLSELNDIVDISNRYGMPITHFFNPRIYLENQFSIYNVNPSEAQYYTYWVLDRQSKGDQIALHLHYYSDLLEEIGVEVREEAKVIGSNRDETSLDLYTLEESEQILQWSIDRFVENGLPRPRYFRSGGWMTSTTLLRALQNLGFYVDSSGRTGGVLNPAWVSSTIIPWNLKATTKPFRPNVGNINGWYGERFSVWEFPNNGADSYWFPTEELISRFDQNYPEKHQVITKPQTLTYLSHPHGFPIYDSHKIRALFDYTGNYLYRNDNGPVVYSTLETAYNNWNKLQYIDGE